MSGFLTLGSVVVFSIVLPGIFLTTVLYFLGLREGMESNLIITSLIVTIGFAANIIGHVSGIIFRHHICPKYKEIPSKLLRTNKKVELQGDIIGRRIEYWFSIYCMYWNTAWGILIILLTYLLLTCSGTRAFDGRFALIQIVGMLSVGMLTYLSIHILNMLYQSDNNGS